MANKASFDYLKSALKNTDDTFKEIRNRVVLTVLDGQEQNESTILECCATMAYGDLCRNLHGIGEKDDNDKSKSDNKKIWKTSIIEYIKERINDIPKEEIKKNIKKDKEKSNNIYDEWHRKSCDGIKERSKMIHMYLDKPKEFTDGLAQKWLNMTLKNILAFDSEYFIWLSELKAVFHVPVDNYVRDAAHHMLGIRGCRNGKYTSVAWSNWDYDTYEKFQNKIRHAISCRDDYKDKCPIDWEFDAWATAKKV